MPNLKLVIEYEGTRYHGWQIQPGVPTIQGVVQARLSMILREPVVVRGAARTDAGVHAVGQTAHVVTAGPADPFRVRRSLNAVLPADIAVRTVESMPDDFHARHSARGRIYRYRIIDGEFISPFERGFVCHVRRPLDEAAMDEAAGRLVGRTDFSSFKAAGDVSDSPVKEIRSSRVERGGPCGTLVTYTVEASSFLQHMVRNIAGTLIEVGRGRLAPASIADILAARERRAAGPTAPARGLFLVKVLYPDLARRGVG